MYSLPAAATPAKEHFCRVLQQKKERLYGKNSIVVLTVLIKCRGRHFDIPLKTRYQIRRVLTRLVAAQRRIAAMVRAACHHLLCLPCEEGSCVANRSDVNMQIWGDYGDHLREESCGRYV